MDVSHRRAAVPSSPDAPPDDLVRCLYVSNKLFTALLFVSLFLLTRHWRDKIRGSIAVNARFIKEESEDEIRDVDCWFETSLGYHPSPFACKIKVERSVHIDSLCDFDQTPKVGI